MGAEKRLLSIKEAFRLAQHPHQNQAKLVVALSRTYGTVSAPGPGRRPSPAPAHPLSGALRGPRARRTVTPALFTFATHFIGTT